MKHPISVIPIDNNDVVTTGYGWSFGQKSGSGKVGMANGSMLTIKGGDSCLQIRGEYNSSNLFVRNYNFVAKTWNPWRKVTLDPLP